MDQRRMLQTISKISSRIRSTRDHNKIMTVDVRKVHSRRNELGVEKNVKNVRRSNRNVRQDWWDNNKLLLVLVQVLVKLIKLINLQVKLNPPPNIDKDKLVLVLQVVHIQPQLVEVDR